MSGMNRRALLRTTGLSLAGFSLSGWLPALAQAAQAAQAKARNEKSRHCILLWMPGGPAQTDTFDMKPDHENGGEFRPAATSVPGLQFSEHLPKLAKLADKMAILRGLSTLEGDHNRGTYLMHTGHRPGGPIGYPTLGSTISKALGNEDAELPNFISVSPYTAISRQAFGPGYLGPRFAPLTVGAANTFQAQQQPANTNSYADLGVDDLRDPGVKRSQVDARLDIWQTLQKSFLTTHAAASPQAHNTVYERAVRMMHSDAAKAFDLGEEPDEIREAYGRGRFGQGCLMARRLIERGVPFVEVALNGSGQGALGWDTHNNNFQRVKSLSEELDAGWATLMTDLEQRGLLESTTILWTGEFGRTPKLRNAGGRDHFPGAWSSVLAGGGIRGGQAFGKTSADGQTVEEGKVNVGDLLATLCTALGIDPTSENISELGRPIQIAEGQPIKEVLA